MSSPLSTLALMMVIQIYNNLYFFTELFKMVCEADEPDVNISFPVAMLPQDASESLKQSLQEKINGTVH
ncbi:putative peptidase A22B, signal peptide peptidase [Helianthus debilis subsp. tardiflorus]